MERTESGEKKATRQCWECLKRRLVCDHTLPHCRKCIKAGKDCPGYDEQKPLQWVEPGKVTSRRRNKNTAPKVYTIRPGKTKLSVPVVANVPAAPPKDSCKSDPLGIVTQDRDPLFDWGFPEDSQHHMIEMPRVAPEAVELYESQLAASLVHKGKAAWWHSMTAEEQTEHVTLMFAKYAAGVRVGEGIMRIGSQKNMKAVVERGQAWEAATLLQSNRDPLEKLKRMLWIMEMNQLPSYEHLSNETSEVVQAVNYCMFDYHAQKALTHFTSQHQNISRRQRDRLIDAKPSCDSLSRMGIAYLTSCHASHHGLSEPKLLHPFAASRLRSCIGCW